MEELIMNRFLLVAVVLSVFAIVQSGTLIVLRTSQFGYYTRQTFSLRSALGVALFAGLILFYTFP